MTSFSCGRLSLEVAKSTLGARASRVIGNNTILSRDAEGGFAVSYHGHEIVRINKRGDMRLDSCGFQTMTTKERFNSLMPSGFYILQKDRVWYLTGPNVGKRTIGAKDDGLVIFQDGMVITAKGEVRGGIKPGTSRDPIRVQKQITKYVDGFTKAFFAGEVEPPGMGDCWMCSMVVSKGGKDDGTAGGADVGKSLGEATGDKDHILGHIKENYFVPSLMLRACKAFPVSPYVGSMIHGIWAKTEPSLAGREEWAVKQLKSSLRKYVQRELGVAS